MSQQYHKHVLDGKEVYYNAETCPICVPQQQTQQQERAPAEVYNKGNTCIIKVSKAQLMTIHWWAKGNAFLFSHKRMARDQKGNRILDRDGKVIWEQVTFRLNVSLTRKLISSLQELVTQTEGVKGVPTRA